MDGTTPPAPQPQGSMETWFTSLPDTQPGGQKPRKKRLLIIVGVLLLLVGIGGFAFARFYAPITCLTLDDYKALTGQEYQDGSLDSSNNFRTYTIEFAPDQTAYASTAEQTGQQIVDEITKFYASHKNKSINLSLSSTYLDDQDKPLAMQRLEYLTTELLKAGIPADNIKIVTPDNSIPEDVSEKITTATISITSASDCRE